MKRARFIAAARLEFLAEVIYHNEAQPGLGERFTAAVEEAAGPATRVDGSHSRVPGGDQICQSAVISCVHVLPP